MSLPRFGVERPVPVNLLMFATIVGGLFASMTLTKEFFPEVTPESAQITLPYPGATPEEVEEGLALKVEDALADLDEIDRMTVTLAEGGGGIFAEFHSSVRDVRKAVDEVERSIDALTDLPDEAEEIKVTEFEARLPVIMVSMFGDTEEEVLKSGVRSIKDDLRSLPGMGEILFSGVRDYEIRVDVSAAALLEHRLSLPQVSDAIRSWMTDVPGGSVRTGVGDIRVRTTGVPERAESIRQIVIKATPDGQALTVGDMGEVREFYVDEQLITRFGHLDPDDPDSRIESKKAMSLTVFKTGRQDAVKIAEMVRSYVRGRSDKDFEPRVADRLYAALNGMMPAEQRAKRSFKTVRRLAWELGYAAPRLPAEISTHSDLARFIEGRLDLLMRNAKWGALLVFATLMVFLNWRVAFWVGMGLLISICGALVIMSIVGITLNLLTMFGLIVVLGLLVDDAIVVAENIQARHDANEPALTAAITGTEQVFWPVVATVLTSIVAFIPLRFINGQIGDLIGALPVVVACALLFSLVESLLILPSHMGHSLLNRDRHKGGAITSLMRRYEQWRDTIILGRIVPAYATLLTRLIKYRYATVAVCTAILIGSVGLVAGGRLDFTFLPSSDSETIIVDLRMPIGTSIARTDAVASAIEQAAGAQPEVKSIGTVIGYMADLEKGTTAGLGGHLAQMYIELVAVERRDRESSAVIDAIRTDVGVISDVERIAFSEIQGGPGGTAITVIVSSDDDVLTEEAVGRIKHMLAEYDGVRDIGDNSSLGQREVHVELKPAAAGLDLTVADVARQVRGSLFGLEPHVFSDRREDIKVRVRLDEQSRGSLYAIENMYILTPTGGRVPLGEVAEVVEGTAYSTINRVDRRRATTVTAATAPWANPERITAKLVPRLEALKRDLPGIAIELGGRQRTMAKAFESLPYGFLAACVMIYLILAWLFGSYVQPIAIMLAIPFAITGVIWGHLLLGYTLTFLSLIGFVALSGIVVNDSLILVQYFNTKRTEGVRLREALVLAGRARLRPIFLTTITTILGLTPLMLEKSFQAKFLIPMAISISFGLMSATILVLIALPCLLVIMDDVKAVAHFLWTGTARVHDTPHPILDAHRE